MTTTTTTMISPLEGSIAKFTADPAGGRCATRGHGRARQRPGPALVRPVQLGCGSRACRRGRQPRPEPHRVPARRPRRLCRGLLRGHTRPAVRGHGRRDLRDRNVQLRCRRPARDRWARPGARRHRARCRRQVTRPGGEARAGLRGVARALPDLPCPAPPQRRRGDVCVNAMTSDITYVDVGNTVRPSKEERTMRASKIRHSAAAAAPQPRCSCWASPERPPERPDPACSLARSWLAATSSSAST